MASPNKYILAVLAICLLSLNLYAKDVNGMISGKVLSSDGEPLDYATVYLKGTSFSGITNDKCIYPINAPDGNYNIEL